MVTESRLLLQHFVYYQIFQENETLDILRVLHHHYFPGKLVNIVNSRHVFCPLEVVWDQHLYSLTGHTKSHVNTIQALWLLDIHAQFLELPVDLKCKPHREEWNQQSSYHEPRSHPLKWIFFFFKCHIEKRFPFRVNGFWKSCPFSSFPHCLFSIA